jgi:hypothetical protein
MQLTFATEAFRNECNNQDLLVKRHGAVMARLIRQRLDELYNSESLADLLSLPHVAVHAWPDSPADLAVEIVRPHWLVFRPEPASGEGKPGAGKWKKVDSIRITGLMRADEKRSPKPI